MTDLWAAAEGGLDGLPTVGQFGLLITLLSGAGIVIKMLFNMAIKSKDAQIAAAEERVKAAEATATERIRVAEERASRYEQKLEEQQQRMQTEVLRVLGEATSTTRRALEITRGNSHDDR